VTIDERIEKLTERHEALAQSVEILNHSVENLAETLRLNSERMDSKILALLTLAGLHQQRLDDLDGGTPTP
jgi:hypothetical protein